MPLILVAQYDTHADFLAAFDSELVHGGLLVRGAGVGVAQAMSECTLVVRVVGADELRVRASVAAVISGVGVAVLLGGVPDELEALAARLRPRDQEPSTAADEPAPPDDGGPRLLSERLKAMNVTQKMQLALAGGREERAALLRDVNKTLHVYVLRNPRIALDEVQHAAKQPTLSPEALKMIADHREWGSHTAVCSALVRNPKTPLPIALRLLDKLPGSDLRAIAKGGARDQLVHAARKKLGAPG